MIALQGIALCHTTWWDTLNDDRTSGKKEKKMKILSMIRVTLRSFLSEILYIGTWKFHTVVYVIYFFQIDTLSYIFFIWISNISHRAILHTYIIGPGKLQFIL